MDLAISVADDEAAELLVRQLIGCGYRMIALVEHTSAKRLATVRLGAPDMELIVDLLFASCGIEAEIVADAESLEILPGLSVPVARAGHLIAMKLLARDDRERPQDLDDLRALMPTLDAKEKRRVRSALIAIGKRGFARGRDLIAAWETLRSTPQTRARHTNRR